MSSYRTYEEWKRKNSINRVFTFNHSSYRTYEEWKLDSVGLAAGGGIEVLTVPMRNGNWLFLLVPLDCCNVLTVPMRNGNKNTL